MLKNQDILNISKLYKFFLSLNDSRCCKDIHKLIGQCDFQFQFLFHCLTQFKIRKQNAGTPFYLLDNYKIKPIHKNLIHFEKYFLHSFT